MNLRLETVSPRELKHLPMSQHMRTFLRRRTTLSRATDVVVARVSGQIVGVFLYHYAARVLTDQGIYVEKAFRGNGVATKMYLHAHANKATRRRTDVTALGPSGAKFISKMREILPSVHLTIHR
jgi:GNAT superfamily N-acetyltransferase